MAKADLSTPRRGRIAIALVVIVLHLFAVLALIRAFAPDFTAKVADQVVAAFTVTTTSPPPSPTPPAKTPDKPGTAGDAGRKASPRPVAAPRPRVVVAKQDAPPVAGAGNANAAGARDAGQGTGAGGAGNGTGAGNGGDGTSGGAATKAVKIAGDINSARDYPRQTRDLRRGDHVVLALTVDTEGRVTACRVHRASRDAEADTITCRLARERFRFLPATDSAGRPVESVYGWKQRWWDPRGAD